MLEVLPQPPPPSAARLATAALLAALAAFASAEPADDGPSPGASPVLEPGQTTVRARYWTGAPALDPALYTVDAGGSVTASDLRPSSALAGEMRAKFDSAGVVHVTNTGLADMGLQRVRPARRFRAIFESVIFSPPSGSLTARPFLQLPRVIGAREADHGGRVGVRGRGEPEGQERRPGERLRHRRAARGRARVSSRDDLQESQCRDPRLPLQVCSRPGHRRLVFRLRFGPGPRLHHGHSLGTEAQGEGTLLCKCFSTFDRLQLE
mmetsp:Transcript_38680/g.92543  ORF Transcript_38680/g.92543 Transcript_38680/m.92543 type:complete len:265 (+) Transcript_38680:234-1028(+)